MDTIPRKFGKSNVQEDSSSLSNRLEDVKKDDDPLSIKDASSIVAGFILALMTMFLPAISVFLERPLLQKNGVIYNEMVTKDGY